MKKLFVVLAASFLAGCASGPIQWQALGPEKEAEYEKFDKPGTGSIKGQAFMQQYGGGTVKAAGRLVTLDPITSISTEWWAEYAQWYMPPINPTDKAPPSPGFEKTRRTTTADSEGRFKFSGLPVGRYYLRTTVTWNVPKIRIIYLGTSEQGGILSKIVEVKDGEEVEVIMAGN